MEREINLLTNQLEVKGNVTINKGYKTVTNVDIANDLVLELLNGKKETTISSIIKEHDLEVVPIIGIVMFSGVNAKYDIELLGNRLTHKNYNFGDFKIFIRN